MAHYFRLNETSGDRGILVHMLIIRGYPRRVKICVLELEDLRFGQEVLMATSVKCHSNDRLYQDLYEDN